MRKNSRENPRAAKDVAKRHYNIRQMDKYIRWSIEVRGFLKWKDLVEQQQHNNITPHD